MRSVIHETTLYTRPNFFHKYSLVLMPLHCLLMYVLMSLGPLAGLVLCIDTDSHLKIETAHAKGADNLPAKDHQRPCLDIPLTSSLVTSRSSPLPADSNLLSRVREPVVLTTFVLLNLPAEDAPRGAFPRPGLISALPMAFLRSTILLI